MVAGFSHKQAECPLICFAEHYMGWDRVHTLFGRNLQCKGICCLGYMWFTDRAVCLTANNINIAVTPSMYTGAPTPSVVEAER